MSNKNEVVSVEDGDEGIIADVLSGNETALKNKNILELPVRIMVSVGAAQLTVQDLLALKQDTVIDLETLIDDPVDIYIGERLIAKGELVEATDDENGIGVKLIEICGMNA